MPRSSRHKSSKHSFRDYSDSERDSSLKERKVKEESSVKALKEGSGDKRKADSKDSKDLHGSGNGEYLEEYGNSKRRKERVDEGVNNRWNGGEDDRGDSSKKSKGSSDSRSRRKDEGEGEETKKSSVKSEGKHKESSRKEGREAGVERDRERKYKEGKSERLLDNEEHRGPKPATEKTELNAQDQLQSPESENQLERRVRRKKDGSGDGDKHQDDTGDTNDRRLSSRDDISKDGRQKDEKHKDERYKDKYCEDIDRDNRRRVDKQRDERPARDHANSRSDDKHSRNEKDAAESRQKKSMPQDSGHDRDRELDHEHERDRDVNYDRDHDRICEREHDRGRDRDRGRRDYERERDQDQDHEQDRDRDHDWDWDRERDRDWDLDRDRDRDRNRDRDVDRDGSYLDERSARYKDSRGRKRSPDDRDDLSDTKSRGIRAHYPDMETRLLSSSRVAPDVERGRSQSRQAHVDATGGSNRRRASPSSSSHGGTDDFRQMTEQRPKTISSKYRSTEKPKKMDDSHLGELSVERSSGSKASPMGLAERSPFSTSLERRYLNRTGTRRSIEVEETGWSSAFIGGRELSATEDRISRDLPPEKPLADESSLADSSFYNRASQSNSSLIPPPPVFRAGVGSPSLMGSLEEDNRVNIGARYKRSGDPNVGRGQGNAWRGAPNWSSPVPNGFIPFPHGPPHGGFQAMMTQYPSPSLFGVRTSMEMNHSGIPYHMPDAERFSSHLRPLGWQNMMDGSGPSHLHGWDVSNGVFRDEPHMYGGAEWDQNRHPMNGRGWESSADMWKVQNGDANSDVSSISQKEDYPVQAPVDDVSAGQAGQCQNNHLGVRAKSVERRLSVSSPAKESSSKSPPRILVEKTPDPSNTSTDDDVARYCRVYLSKLDISAELAGPEFHSQCMSLLEKEPCTTVDEEITMLVDLKDGGRAVPKSYITLLSSSLFPATNDSVFQRAMNLYKKQRVEMSGLPIVDNGRFDVLFACNQENVEEQGHIHSAENGEEAVLISGAEFSKEPGSTLDEQKAEAFLTADAEEKLEEHVSAPSPEVRHPYLNTNLEMLGEDFGSGRTEELKPIFNGDKVDVMTAEHVITEDAGDDGFHSLDIASQAAATLPSDGDMNETSNAKENYSVHCTDEGQAFGDAFSGHLVFPDVSPKASGALIPGSNGSESVILSRIHHSPESTH